MTFKCAIKVVSIQLGVTKNTHKKGNNKKYFNTRYINKKEAKCVDYINMIWIQGCQLKVPILEYLKGVVRNQTTNMESLIMQEQNIFFRLFTSLAYHKNMFHINISQG